MTHGYQIIPMTLMKLSQWNIANMLAKEKEVRDDVSALVFATEIHLL